MDNASNQANTIIKISWILNLLLLIFLGKSIAKIRSLKNNYKSIDLK